MKVTGYRDLLTHHGGGRPPDPELRAAALAVSDADVRSGSPRDGVHDGKAEARAPPGPRILLAGAALGGEIRLKDAFAELGRDPGPVIGDDEFDPAGRGRAE